MRNGCAWNHSASRPGTMSLPHYLGPLGYRVGLAGKVHVTPPSSFPFESIGGFDSNCVRSPTQPHRLDEVTRIHHSRPKPAFLPGGGIGRTSCALGDGRSLPIPS